MASNETESPDRSPQRDSSNLIWRVSRSVGALTDGERHIGHVVRNQGRWDAFDATQLASDGEGFLLVGTFHTLEAAQQALEQAWLDPAPPNARAAGA